MTEHFTQEEAVQLAREIDPDAFKYDGISAKVLTATVNLAASRAVAEVEKDTGWISVDGSLPEGRVLVLSKYVGRMVASRTIPNDNPDLWTWGVINGVELDRDEVTHWMPLPKEPNGAIEAKKGAKE